jgi:hypothetical protein
MPNLNAMAAQLPERVWHKLQRPPRYTVQTEPRQRPDRVNLNDAQSVPGCPWFPNAGVGQEVMRWCGRHHLGGAAAVASEGLVFGRWARTFHANSLRLPRGTCRGLHGQGRRDP